MDDKTIGLVKNQKILKRYDTIEDASNDEWLLLELCDGDANAVEQKRKWILNNAFFMSVTGTKFRLGKGYMLKPMK